jgi:hypothetical protein
MHVQKFWVLAHNFKKAEQLQQFTICDLETRDVAFPTGRDLIIGCLDPESSARAIGAANCGARSRE